MEFHQKLQELRKQKGLTQEELANTLFVSRTAISKWESGRGYPNIDSLKTIAKFFSVTVDELLSADEILILAETDTKRKENYFCDLVYGLLDLSVIMLLFLPFFAQKVDGKTQCVSLALFDGVRAYTKIIYIVTVVLVAVTGVLTLALHASKNAVWLKGKALLSLGLGAFETALFIVGLQLYPAIFCFCLLTIKVFMRIKWQ